MACTVASTKETVEKMPLNNYDCYSTMESVVRVNNESNQAYNYLRWDVYCIVNHALISPPFNLH